MLQEANSVATSKSSESIPIKSEPEECVEESILDTEEADSYHMITQYNWEEDIIWNGDDVKHKVGEHITTGKRTLYGRKALSNLFKHCRFFLL